MFAVLSILACVPLATARQATEDKKPAGKKAPAKAPAKTPSNTSHKAAATAAPAGMKAAPPSAEIQKVIKLFAGSWTVEEKYEASEFMPMAGTATGTDAAKAGPGGYSLLRDYRSKGAMGPYSGHGIIYWAPGEKAYKYIWCDSMSADGCEVGASGKFEGDDLVFTASGEFMGKKYKMKLGYNDIKPDSYTFYIDQAFEGGPMKRTFTSHFTRKTAPAAAAAATKK
jgi:hypothetical protein